MRVLVCFLLCFVVQSSRVSDNHKRTVDNHRRAGNRRTYNFDAGATTCYACSVGKFTTHQASAECDMCKDGYYRNGDTCQICPSGKFCPGGQTSQIAIALPRASLSTQKTVLGLSDFTCIRGYYKIHGLFCCNFNTLASASILDGCSLCMPGFYYDSVQQMCIV
jgi:hypothetical protein